MTISVSNEAILKKVKADILRAKLATVQDIAAVAMEEKEDYATFTFKLNPFNSHGVTKIQVLLYHSHEDGKTYKVVWKEDKPKSQKPLICTWEDEPHTKKKNQTSTEPKHWHWHPRIHNKRAADLVLEEPQNVVQTLLTKIPEDYKQRVLDREVWVLKSGAVTITESTTSTMTSTSFTKGLSL